MSGQQKKYTLKELTAGLDVTIQGDPEYVIEGVCTIQQAKPACITFLINPLYKKYLSTTDAGAVVLSPSDADSCPRNALIAQNPYYTYAKIAAYFDDKPFPPLGIHPTAVIGKGCQIDPSVRIAPHCVIGDHVQIGANVVLNAGCIIGDFCEIGQDTYFHANVTLLHKIKIGKNVLIASGTVIGSDGFGLAKQRGAWYKVPQLGSVVIEDDVEIGANCTIDRGAVDNTVIEQGVKLDNLIQVAHNVRIGAHTAIASLVGISGSTTIGKNCLVGGQAGFAGHLTIADNAIITGGTEVSKSIREPGIYSSGVGGLVTNQERRKTTARVQRLDKLQERIKLLEAALEKLNSAEKQPT